MMEVRLLAKGYKNNEMFYRDFLDGRIDSKEDYFSNEIATIDIEEAPDFPIYMGSGGQGKINQDFLEAFRIISKSYINIDRDYILDGTFWHSFLVTYKRQFILDNYPEVKKGMQKFKNIVLKKFDWENYIYKCVIGAQYIHDNINETEREKYFQLVIDNLDVYNYIIKYPIFRNDVFLVKALDIIDELGWSKIMKAKIKDRDDLGKDERYGRRVFFEFNKSYPVVMAPLLDKEELKEYFIEYLGYYYDLTQLNSEAQNARDEASSTYDYNRVAEYGNSFEQDLRELVTAAKKTNTNVIAYLERNNLEYVDKRDKGGTLWVIGSKEIGEQLKPLEEEGLQFKFKLFGGRASKYRSAWYLV